MAEILAFQNARNGTRKSVGGPAEILFFTGVRVQYHEPDLTEREPAGARRKRRPAKKALSN
jgi:hypothetical protein